MAVLDGLPEFVARDMLGHDIVDALLAAGERLGDESLMVRFGVGPVVDGEPSHLPGLASIERAGHDTVYGLDPAAVPALLLGMS
jgi:hypothetical protein